MDNQIYRDKIEKSLLKKALGYRYKEVRRFGGKIREFQPKWSMSMI